MEQPSLPKSGCGRIVLRRTNARRRVTVFFAGRHACGPRIDDGYGSAFALRHGLNAVLVQPNRPRWYQGPLGRQLPQLLAEVLAGFDHVTFGGAGMGAYGALLAAQHIAADHVLAVHPVSTLDPRKAPLSRAQRRDGARLGRDIAPVLTHRARHYTLVATGPEDAVHAARMFLPAGRTTRLNAGQLTPGGTLGLSDRALLGLLGAAAPALARAG
ncbi:hypothetical protein [Roseisalinus antarcticus]|uniref:Alpha/beta hydrolase family protein n=1 Tax=Roseisalinus antarcticus TaxID=254357 RepID=A0A1Y5SG73_9RHOB|nr:hypothetical protein [Roseisalinus antarcticus]SLN37263.1 hypothetical protein ROA7023_01389 [Roseisalinus antarcticus]